MIDLSNKTAIVIGGSGGIGTEVSERLYQLHANLILIGRTEKNVKLLARKLDPSHKQVLYYGCDILDEAELNKIRDDILKKLKKIDILVTCFAAPPCSGKSEALSFADWRTVLGTDLDGVFLACKTFGSSMIQQRYGRIVNLTSFHTIATYPYRLAYNAAKSGVEGITRALAVEWGSYGITVNAVAPGPIMTPRTSWFLSQSPDNEAGMIGRTPKAMIGEPRDVADLIAFLVSDCARHINGQQIVIDGGWTKSAWWGKYEKKY